MSSVGNPTSPPTAGTATLGGKLRVFADDIKIHHTIFALPWAVLCAVLAGRWFPGSLTAGKIGLILFCMVTARTVAMSANRIIDSELDARNPRTAGRALPSRSLSRRFVAAILIICSCGFIAAAAGFEILYRNIWPLAFSLPVLAYLCGYPFMKRLTRLCHYYLGVALALAPTCAWVAVAGRVDWPPAIIFIIVAAWTAGFDIIYACQDFSSDRECGVYSVPAKIGISNALWVSRITHFVAAAMLVVLGCIVPQFGLLYFLGAARPSCC